MPVTAILMGWTGGGIINGANVLVTSANVEESHQPAYFQSIDVPAMGSTSPYSRYVYAEGLKSSQGSMSFDISQSASGVLTLLTRGVEFDVSFGDGIRGTGGSLGGCYVTSLSFSGSVGGLVTGSCSFVSKEEWGGGTGSGPGLDEEPIGYWKSGGAGNIRDWSLSMSQSATPIYANEQTAWPNYIKVTTVDYTLTVNSLSEISTADSVNIGLGTKTISGVASGSGFSYNGAGDFNTYSYTFESTSGPGGSGDVLIS